MRLHRIIPQTRAEGPGVRFCLWVQGCHTGCPGCYARDLWDPQGGYEADPGDILAQIAATEGIEGITFLGGEPMEQAEALAYIARGTKELGLSVLTFTGLTYESLLEEGDPHRLALLKETDLLIDGPYRKEQHDTSRPWVGSRNQRYRFLTDRYGPRDVETCHNRIELRLTKEGILRLNGMGDFPGLEAILQSKTFTRGSEDGIHKL